MNLTQKRISSIKLPGDIKLAEAEAADSGLAASVKEHGVMVPIIIDDKGNLVAGRNRVMAAKAAGLKTIPAITRKDADRGDTIRENLHRRHLSTKQRDALLKEYVELQMTQGDGQGVQRAAPTKKAVLEKVAAETGVSPRTVQRAVDDEPKVGGWGVDEEGIPGFDTWGMELEEAEEDAFRAAIKQWEFIESTTRLLIAALSGLPSRVSLEEYGNATENLHRLAKQEKPGALCPWCKHHPSLTGDCEYCMGAGWISTGSAREAPSELKSGAARVMRKGKIVLFSKIK